MAHFAEIDESNIVLRVLVVPDDEEHRGDDYLADDLGLDGTWLQTSYRTHAGEHPDGAPLRGNFAGVGYTYDPSKDVFYSPQPYPSWTLDETTFRWEPPVPRPDDGNSYSWDEDTTAWVAV